MNRRLIRYAVYGFVPTVIAVLALAIIPASSDTDSNPPLRGELKLQVSREIQELKAQQRRDQAEYQALQGEVDKADAAMKKAADAYAEASFAADPASPQVAEATEQLTQSQNAFYALLTRREHALYKINANLRGISDRERLLSGDKTAEAPTASPSTSN